MKIDLNTSSVLRPDDAPEISNYARRALRAASAEGVLPRPIDDLLDAAHIGNLKIDEEAKERFVARLVGPARLAFNSIWQKVRGPVTGLPPIVLGEALGEPARSAHACAI